MDVYWAEAGSIFGVAVYKLTALLFDSRHKARNALHHKYVPDFEFALTPFANAR